MSVDHWCSSTRLKQNFSVKILPTAPWVRLHVSILHHTSQPPYLSCTCFVWAALSSASSLRGLSSVSFRLLLCMLSDSQSIYPALCVWWARRHRWNNNCSTCLYREVSQLVQGTQETQCKTIIYNNTTRESTEVLELTHVREKMFDWYVYVAFKEQEGLLGDWIDKFCMTFFIIQENTACCSWERDWLRPSWDRQEPAGMTFSVAVLILIIQEHTSDNATQMPELKTQVLSGLVLIAANWSSNTSRHTVCGLCLLQRGLSSVFVLGLIIILCFIELLS